MANNLNIELMGKWVLLVKDYFKEGLNPLNNLFLCENGFGTSPNTIGNAIFGHFQDGEKARIEGFDVERLATEKEANRLNILEKLR